LRGFEQYIEGMISDLYAAFGERLCYVGLQGSYLRGEAHDGSDLDLMVVIDRLTTEDLMTYRACLANRGDAILSCGFLCGREALAAWNPLEILHVQHSTKDLYGVLAPLLPPASMEDHRHYVQLSLCNLYHALCHRYVHTSPENSREKLGEHEKELFFLLQDLHYLRSGVFAATRAALYAELLPAERAVWDAVTTAKNSPDTYDFSGMFALILDWCQRILRELSETKDRL